MSVYGEIECEIMEYSKSLDYPSQRRYANKLQIDGEKLPDPYEILDTLWQDDVTKWPNMEFGDLYTYLIDTKGPYTKESLKAYKSLQAYNYFYNGYVRTVYIFEPSNSNFSILKAKINPSQKAPDQNHEAWVIVAKASGEIKTAHCKCMAGYVYFNCL